MILKTTDMFLGFAIILYFYIKTRRRSSLPLPPGPKKLPLLGNLFDMPKNEQWLKYIQWGKQFSMFPVVHPPSELVRLTL